MFEALLERNILMMPEVKHPNEVRRTDNKKYYAYHRLVSHLDQGLFCSKIQDSVKVPTCQISVKEDIRGGK